MRKKTWMGVAGFFGLGCVGLSIGLGVAINTTKSSDVATAEVDPSTLDQKPVAEVAEDEPVDLGDTNNEQDATTDQSGGYSAILKDILDIDWTKFINWYNSHLDEPDPN